MSTLSVDMIEPVGSTLTLGQSGDTVTIPVGGTFTNSGTANGFAAGSTHSSDWRLTTSFISNIDPIASNLEAVIADVPTTTTTTPSTSTALGAPMVLTSGVFKFPVTGFWQVSATSDIAPSGYSASGSGVIIKFTTNDSTWNDVTTAWGQGYLNYHSGSYGSVIVKILDITQDKVSFRFYMPGGGTCVGSATANATCMSFVRLGDI